MSIKLDIGCGVEATTKEGFIGVDAHTDAQVKADMWDLPYRDGEVDEIHSSNALEHISKFQVIPTLQEWKRVLKLGGLLDLNVPDLEWACMWWIMHQSIEWDMDIIYGTQLHDGEFHKTGFSTKIIWEYLNKVGGFHVQSIEYTGGKSELSYQDSVGIVDNIEQKIITVKAIRIEEPD